LTFGFWILFVIWHFAFGFPHYAIICEANFRVLVFKCYNGATMFIEATKIIGLSIASIEEKSKVGEILQLVIDPKNGSLLGFLVRSGGIFSQSKALSVVDIREWDPNGLVIGSVNHIVPVDEIVRLKEIVDQKLVILGLKAQTESGKNLGVIENLLIDTDTLTVAKYYIKNILLGDERVFPSNRVIKIDKTVVFQDDATEIPTGVQSATI